LFFGKEAFEQDAITNNSIQFPHSTESGVSMSFQSDLSRYRDTARDFCEVVEGGRCEKKKKKCSRGGSNSRHMAHKTIALTTELHEHYSNGFDLLVYEVRKGFVFANTHSKK
jgi:hypothetical protein